MTQEYKPYAKTIANPNFADLEIQIIEKWKAENTFEKSVRGEGEFVFYDGPPFANGLPHYGHLLTGFIKDLFARFQTMLGNKVERRFGWDCHGLPAEMAAEKDLNLSGKVDIEKYGIGNFNDYCRTSVLKYTNEWEDYVNRQARWVDFENDYKTMETPYMESVLWAFKELHKKGLIYESYRVMPYSWACETPVSDFETRMDNSYREKVSKALTVKFKLKEAPAVLARKYKACYMVAWTTTPWTLPSNLALAVSKDIKYVCVEKDDEVLIFAQDLVHKYEDQVGDHIIAELKGSDLIGLAYDPLFDYFADHPNAFVVLHGDFVSTEDGTGIVHIAPGFGEDDQLLCKQHNIDVVCPVDTAGKFIHPVRDYLGKQVFEANDPITQKLKAEGLIVKIEQYLHNYPHCWRTDTPLIYRALPSWYVKVTDIKDKMISNNQQINWIPSHIKDGLFGKWLENARDWSISRNRYWGCPIPVWKSDDPEYPCIEVYGSIAELEAAFGVEVKDLHRPFIDTLVKPNPNDPTGKSMLRRVTDVLDCWFESGSMPFAQVHYPFENKNWFESHFPADFIVEYLAQTRGWFYTLVVLSTALFDRPPFLNCICHGVLLGDGGQKLSKRLKNYPDPNLVFNTLGADALRWFMISSPVMRGQELVMDSDASGIKDALKLAVKPIWNAFNFFTLYANADSIRAVEDYSSTNILDRYILSKCMEVLETVRSTLEKYDTVNATKCIEEFLEVLNNWYIRRSRERFWKSEKDQDKVNAYNTLYTLLINLCKVAAPLMPLTLEKIYLSLNDVAESVHLEMYPSTAYKADYVLVNQMERVRAACTAALSLRNEVGIRVRQPLAKVTFIGVSNDDIHDDLKQLVLDEINVKEWIQMDQDEIVNFANYKLQLNFPVIGKRIPSKVKDIISAQKQNNWKIDNGTVIVGDEVLQNGEFQLLLEPKVGYENAIAALPSNDGLVYLDISLTDELKLEGAARDLVRAIQQTRKDMDLNMSDRIEVAIESTDHMMKGAINGFGAYIKEQTLAKALEASVSKEYQHKKELDVEGIKITLYLSKI
ncbi:MAG: isoleucine--tRNA ligase [Alphaproteobacteria bacterium]|jgi:isoleucyl-tRNA synthetase